jgi:hypothetical protein
MPGGVLDAGGGGPPPAPNPNAQQQNGVLTAPKMPSPTSNVGNMLMGGAPPPGSAPGPQQGQGQGAPGRGPQQGMQGPPTPTHGQTVAALRHFDAIQNELKTLLKDPAVGKSDVKKKIIDGMSKLVANRIVTPGAAVGQLADVPDKPFDQRKWLQTHLIQTVIAKVTVLNHHGAAFGGVPEDQIDKTASPDNHLSDMASLQSHYQMNRTVH